MSEYSTDDAVKFALNKDTANFKTAVNDILAQKVSDALELKRVEVAHNFMSAPETEPEEVQSNEEI